METRLMTRHTEELNAKARAHKVRHLNFGYYSVVSAKSGKEYFVNVFRGTCTCDWASKRRHDVTCTCSHFASAMRFHAAHEVKQRPPKMWADKQSARRWKRRMVDWGDNVTVTY